MRKYLLFAGLIAGISCPAMGDLIADFTADYQTPSPKTGWTYMHNGANVAVGSEGYLTNTYNASGNWYTTNGGNLPQPYPDGYSVVASGFMHPGGGSTQTADGLDHFTLARFTLSTGGDTVVTNIAASTGGGGGGTELWVNVNTEADQVPVANRIISANGSYGGPTSIDLGVLSAGDRVYVGIGPHGNDGNDSTNIQFQITQTPEPVSLGLIGIGSVGLLVRRRRH